MYMLLNQTSEWEGVMWGKPDVADRRRGYNRSLEEPGTFWEYNDVRVNRLALSLLRVWNKPLPQVLKEEIMDPIGASDTWVWHGYRNSYVQLHGRAVQSVSGGSHWGGGLWASTRDRAFPAICICARASGGTPGDLLSAGYRWRLRPRTWRRTTAICSGSTPLARLCHVHPSPASSL
jgi:CubicO group peptidase (beta-lactamase class C family)